MAVEKMKTINAAELAQMELPPIQFVVDGLLPQGLHILAGAPKTGKSWLLLFLCLKTAKGEDFWNRKTKRGTVLYLCLEDNEARLQARLDELTSDPPANMFLATMAHSLSEGLIEQMKDFLSEHKDTVLIVIDTLQKVRSGINDTNPYAGDYKDIGLLKNLADDYGVTMIVVQHLRKQYDVDPHSMVTGSTGLLGAADGSYVLQKEKDRDGMAKLFIRGRDIEEQILTICFSKETMTWEFISGNTPAQEELKKDKIISFLMEFMKKEMRFVGTAGELSEKLMAAGCPDVNPNVLSRKLKKYADQLQQEGISYAKNRSGERRMIALAISPSEGAVYDNDDNDANDDIFRSGEYRHETAAFPLPNISS